METLYLTCVVVGGTVFVCQFLLTLIGVAGESADGLADEMADDIGDDLDGNGHASAWFFGVLSFKTIVAALTFFGLAGKAASANEASNEMTLTIAVLAGLAAMYGVHWMMLGLNKLRADGTTRIQRAVGKTAKVYLTIPANKSGAGKVTISVQNRTMEYRAITAQSEITTGKPVVVVNVVGSDTLEVESAAEPVGQA